MSVLTSPVRATGGKLTCSLQGKYNLRGKLKGDTIAEW